MIVLTGAVAGCALIAACSSNRDRGVADVTLPELDTTTTTTPPATSPALDEQQAPAPTWTVQVGGEGDDLLLAVTGHENTVIAVGSTNGAVVDPGAPPTTTVPSTTTTTTMPTTSVPPRATDLLVGIVDTDAVVRSLKVSGSDGDDAARGVTVADAQPLACGSTTGTLGSALGGATDLWCGLLGADGLPAGPGIQMGGTDSEEVSGVAAGQDLDRVYLSGRVSGLLPGAQDPTGRGLGSGDAITLQLGLDGAPIWARQFGTEHEDAALGVASAPDGDGIVVGFTDGNLGRASSGGRDAWISRFDPAGRQRWITQFGSAGTDVFHAVTVSGEARRGTEQFIAAGTTDGILPGTGGSEEPGALRSTDAFVSAFGTDGALNWATTLTADDHADGADRATAIVGDGAIVYVAGTTTRELGELAPETGPGGGADGFLAAVDAATGQVLWVTRFGSDGDEEITGITTTEDGLLVLSGTTTGQMAQTEPGGGVDGFLIAFPLSSAGGGAASSV